MSAVENITLSVDLSRICAPTIPANFINRRHLFSLFETGLPGVTVVAAPAGYGKSSLVAQWATDVERPTIWLTIDPTDSVQLFFQHMVQSIRVVFPDFGSDFELGPSADPVHNVKKLTQAAGEIKSELNFVIDNGSTDNPDVSPFAQALISSLPNNVHLVIVRRVTPATSLARYASLGNLSLITSHDLKFSPEEILKVASINGADLSLKHHAKLINRCEGWPAAVQMVSRSLSNGQEISNFNLSGNHNPLGILAQEVFSSLNQEHRFKFSRLLMMSEFDLEAAAIVLGEDFSEDYINKLVTDGVLISVSSGTTRIFKFNDLFFQALSNMDFESRDTRKVLHGKLADHFLTRGRSNLALEHIYQSGDLARMEEVLEISIREMAACGRGDQIIKWAEYAADSSIQGELMKKIIKVVGHLVNLDFDRAEALAAELEFISSQSAEMEFLTQLTSMIFAHVYFARGEFTRSLEMIDSALGSKSPMESIENTDRIALLRLKASIHFIYDQPAEVNLALVHARSLMKSGNLTNAPYYVSCMTSMALWSEGRFFEAAEHASIAINQAINIGYTGIHAPLDAYMVLGRCQLELSNRDKAVEICEILIEKSLEFKIWPWYFLAEGTAARIKITKGQVPPTLERINSQRVKLATLRSPNELSWIIDMTEVFLRFTLDDWDRAEELLRRMPKIELVRQIDLNAKFKADPKKIPALVEAFPENNPRERVNKFLYQATLNIDTEKQALAYLNKALDIGAEVGFHEYFVRQHRLYPLMVKAASAQPTVFRESVVHEMTERIQAMNTDTGALDEKLTPRELEILKHLTTGIPLSTIAKQLHISQNTMKTHLRNVYRKLEVDGRHSAVEKAKKLLLI